MKKKLSLLVALFIGVLALPNVVKAQAAFSFDCTTILQNVTLDQPSTTCALKVVPDPNEEAITTVKVQIISNNMTLNNFIHNDMIWDTDGSKDSDGFMTFTNKTGATFPSGTSIGSIDATIMPTATSCGEICVAIAYTTASGEEVTINNVQGATEAGKCTITTTTPPPTGVGTTIANYIVLAGGAVIALAAIAFARKSTKFYRV